MPTIAPDQIDVEAAKPVLRDLLQAGSRLYMHFARETIAAFGERVGMTVRHYLREYGKWRGRKVLQRRSIITC